MIIRKYQSSEKDEIATFHGFKDGAFLEYEYGVYMPEKSVLVTGRQDDQLVATQAFMPYRLNINGKTILTGRSERTLMKKSLRGAGNFKVLMDEAVQCGQDAGMMLLWGSTLAKNAFEKVGFEFYTGFLEHAIATISYTSALKKIFSEKNKKKILSQIVALIASPISRLVGKIIFFQSRLNNTLVIHDKPLHEADVPALYAKIRGNSNLITIQQDLAFTSWAYEKSNRNYRRYYGYNQQELIAYCVIDLTEDGDCCLADFTASDFNAMSVLWFSIVDDLKKNGIGCITVAYNYRNQQLARVSGWLKRMGFVPFYRRGGFVLRNINMPDVHTVRDISNWYITPLWTALFKR